MKSIVFSNSSKNRKVSTLCISVVMGGQPSNVNYFSLFLAGCWIQPGAMGAYLFYHTLLVRKLGYYWISIYRSTFCSFFFFVNLGWVSLTLFSDGWKPRKKRPMSYVLVRISIRHYLWRYVRERFSYKRYINIHKFVISFFYMQVVCIQAFAKQQSYQEYLKGLSVHDLEGLNHPLLEDLTVT